MTDSNRVQGYKKGRDMLKIQYCPDCEKYIFFPRELCPYCLQVKPEWQETCGRGRVYSYTVVRKSFLEEFSEKVPYIYAVVELHEGIRMSSNLTDCPVDKIKIGMPVELAWADESKNAVPVFRPAVR